METKETTLFRIQGYFIDDGSEIDALVCSYNDCPKDMDDDAIFFYGLSEKDIVYAIENKEAVCNEFMITEYLAVN